MKPDMAPEQYKAAVMMAQPHDLSAKRRMLGLTCHILFPNTDRAKTSPLQCDGGKLTLILRSSVQPKHWCCSKAEAAGRTPDFGRTKGTSQATEKPYHLQQHVAGL